MTTAAAVTSYAMPMPHVYQYIHPSAKPRLGDTILLP